MPVLPFGEWRPDVSDLNASTSVDIVNVLPRADGYGPAPSINLVSPALPKRCRGVFRAWNADGTVTVFAGTEDRLYKLDNTLFTWDDVSKDTSSGFSYGVSTRASWVFVQYDNRVFATQIGAPIQAFTLGTSTAFEDLSASAPQCSSIAVVGRFLVASGILGARLSIQWSAINDPESWTAGTDQSDVQDFADGGEVVGVAGSDDVGLVFQAAAIRRMVYAPGSPVIFQIDRVPGDIGCSTPRSIVQAAGLVFWFSGAGFYRMAPSGYPEPIGKERVDRTFVADYNPIYPANFMGAADPTSSRILWAYCSVNGAPNLGDKVLVYDYVLNRWSILEVQTEFIGSIGLPGMTLEGLDTAYPEYNLDTLPFSLDDFAETGALVVAVFDPTHAMGLFSGSALEATLETGEMGSVRRVLIRGITPMSDAPALFGSISTRGTLQSARIWAAETAPGVTGMCPARRETRFARARVRIPAGTVWSYITGVDMDSANAGTR